MTASDLNFKQSAAKSLVDEVTKRSGQNLSACYQCRRCAAGCTVGDETDGVTPDRLIRMIMLGDRQNAQRNALVWKCVACYTCGTRCPNDIQTGKITSALKKMAKERHVEPLQPKVVYFHDAFMDGIRRWGRINEGEFMGFYELKNAVREAKNKNYQAIFDELKGQAKLAQAMMKLKRMHFKLNTAKGRKEVKRLFKKAKGTTNI